MPAPVSAEQVSTGGVQFGERGLRMCRAARYSAAAAAARLTLSPSALLTAIRSASSTRPFLMPCNSSPAPGSIKARKKSVMEVFKTSVGSWIYPEASVFHVGGVPLFSGFMYASIGSYIARCWRLFAFRFDRHPPMWAVYALAAAIYLNFYLHHYVFDVRYLLFLAAAVLFVRTWWAASVCRCSWCAIRIGCSTARP